MAEQRNLHILPELKIFDSSPLRPWKDIPASEPKIAAKILRMKKDLDALCGQTGWDKKTAAEAVKCRGPVLYSPHGLVFRSVNNLKFVYSILAGLDIQMDLGRGFVTDVLHHSGMAYYGGRNTDCKLFTSTTTSIQRAIVTYGRSWGKHLEFSAKNHVIETATLGRARLDRSRLLLLAIEPNGDGMEIGADSSEILVRGKIPLSRIYILNEAPELVKRMIELEIEAGHTEILPKEVDKHIEKFLGYAPNPDLPVLNDDYFKRPLRGFSF